MLLTEEQVRTKRCPLPMGVMYDQQVQNCCIASGCAAWRFESKDDFEDRYARWEDAGNLGPDVTRGPEPQPLGYCGAFGKPEV